MDKLMNGSSSNVEGDPASTVTLSEEKPVETAPMTASTESDNHGDIVDEFEFEEEEEEEDEDDSSPEWRWGKPRGPPKAPVGGQKLKQNDKSKKDDKSKNDKSKKDDKSKKEPSSGSSSGSTSSKKKEVR